MIQILRGKQMIKYLTKRNLPVGDSFAIILEKKTRNYLKIGHAPTPHMNEIEFCMDCGQFPTPEEEEEITQLQKKLQEYSYPVARGFTLSYEYDTLEKFGDKFIPLLNVARIFCTSLAAKQDNSSKYCMVIRFRETNTASCVNKLNFFKAMEFIRFDPFENDSKNIQDIELMEGNCHDPLAGDNEDGYIHMRLWINRNIS